jgi:hypothetical protein
LNKKLYFIFSSIISIITIGFIFSGCETADSNINDYSSAVLVNVVDLDSDGECGKEGGFAIYTGLDDDGDGLLLENEYSQKDPKILCNGKQSLIESVEKRYLTDSEQEDFYERCGEQGGAIFKFGLDENSNGYIDGEEHYELEFVCSGSNGKNGVTFDKPKDKIENGKKIGYTLTFHNEGTAYNIDIDNGKDGQNGKDGITPIVKLEQLDGKDENGLCANKGGVAISVNNEEPLPICNGRDDDDVVSNLKLDYNSSNHLSLINQDSGKIISQVVLAEKRIEVIPIPEGNSTCPYKGYQFIEKQDTNEDGIISDNERIESKIICNPDPKSLSNTPPEVTKVEFKDSNKTILFSFNEPMNPATINNSTVFVECNNSAVYGAVTDVNYNYERSDIIDYNLTIVQKDDADNFSTGCKFIITKYVEDINGTNLVENNVTNFK